MANKTNRTDREPGRPRDKSAGTYQDHRRRCRRQGCAHPRRAPGDRARRRSQLLRLPREGLGRPRDRGRDRRRQRGADAVAAARCLQPDDPARGCAPRHEASSSRSPRPRASTAGAQAAGAEGGRGRGQGQLPQEEPHPALGHRGAARQRPGHRCAWWARPSTRAQPRLPRQDYATTNVLTFAYAEGEAPPGLPAAAGDVPPPATWCCAFRWWCARPPPRARP